MSLASGRRRRRHSASSMPLTIVSRPHRNNNNQQPELLLSLAEMCRSHKTNVHSVSHEAMPEACSKSIASLRKILPKLEQQCHVSSIADFYTDVLNGGFCPYAPQVLEDDTVDRIEYLLNNLQESVVSTLARVLMILPSSQTLDALVIFSKDLLLAKMAGLQDIQIAFLGRTISVDAVPSFYELVLRVLEHYLRLWKAQPNRSSWQQFRALVMLGRYELMESSGRSDAVVISILHVLVEIVHCRHDEVVLQDLLCEAVQKTGLRLLEKFLTRCDSMHRNKELCWEAVCGFILNTTDKVKPGLQLLRAISKQQEPDLLLPSTVVSKLFRLLRTECADDAAALLSKYIADETLSYQETLQNSNERTRQGAGPRKRRFRTPPNLSLEWSDFCDTIRDIRKIETVSDAYQIYSCLLLSDEYTCVSKFMNLDGRIADLRDVIVKCGIYVDINASEALKSREPVQDFLAFARAQFWDLCGGSIYPDRVPEPLLETLKCHSSAERLSLFGTIPCKRHAGNVQVASGACLGPLLEPVTADDSVQARRLEYVSATVGLVAVTADLKHQTLNALSKTDRQHAKSLVRLCLWQMVAWLFCSGEPLEFEPLVFLIRSALRDPDESLQNYFCEELLNVLSSHDFASLKACLGKKTDKDAVSSFFDIVDKGSFDGEAREESSVEESGDLYGRSQTRLWGALLNVWPCPSAFGKLLFQGAMGRLVRLWAKLTLTTENSVAFAKFSSCLVPSRDLPFEDMLETIAPVLFRELLADSEDPKERCSKEELERRFEMLSVSLETLISPNDGSLVARNASDAEHLLEACLPVVISQFIVDRDIHSLKLTTAYKLYVLGRKREELNRCQRSSTSKVSSAHLGAFVEAGSLSVAEEKSVPATEWRRKLPDKLQKLCLAPPLVEQIIPLVFTRAGKSELEFFIETVLQGKITLGKLVSSRQMLAFKNFALELGRQPEQTGSIIRGIRLAAVARSHDSDLSTLVQDCLVDGKGDSEVSEWVTSNFLYLLVNVVQLRWSAKSSLQRVRSLRALALILPFLRSTEAYQFFPQVMASVNAALVDSPLCDDKFRVEALKVLAVEVLSRYLKLVALSHPKILGENLTSVVVSLVPVFSFENDDISSTAECRAVAVSILEWLVEGELGLELAGAFSKIPFIPNSPALDTFRSSLRAIGVNFDNVRIASSQQDAQLRSSASDIASLDTDSPGAGVSIVQQTALKRRLETICSLLGDENASTRRVVLEHLTSLLRANREIFHGLMENEGAMSTKRYLTVQYSAKRGFARGTLTEVMDVLLSRCVQETDPEARILLATCIGEVGAIGVHRLEGMNGSNEGVEFYKKVCPPWHSTAHAYGLQLVTVDLVTALKTATSSMDQNKIAFSIQQLLSLLNEAAKDGLISSPGRVPKLHRRRGTTGGSSTSKSPMVQPLVDALASCGVADVVEPFWYSEYHEPENVSPKPPPYFDTATSYYAWLSSWARYMVYRAYAAEKTEWTALLHACRTALRTVAGVDIAEFLLPLLLIDCLVFGSGQDESVVLSEIKGILSLDRDSHLMPLADRRKAVSTVLRVLSLLKDWSEPENESKYRKDGRNQREDRSRRLFQDSPSTRYDWQACRMHINGLHDKIPLSLRAKASASVEMHACALRFIEMASRASVAQSVFGGKSMTYDLAAVNHSRATGTVPESCADSMKDVLASLSDSETLSSLMSMDSTSARNRVRDSIRLKESLGDWQGALHDYEWAQQMALQETELRQGALRCLLEQGHFETVLQLIDRDGSDNPETNRSVGVEASWRLGKWETLSRLTDIPSSSVSDPESACQLNIGKSVLCLHRQDLSGVMTSIRDAREAVMEGLSSAALESYSRAYSHVVKLQAIREIEDVAELLCSGEKSSFGPFVRDPAQSWDSRFDLVSSSGANLVTNTRLALARLGGDNEFEVELMLLNSKRGRKSGLYEIAANACDQAEACLVSVDVGTGRAASLRFAVLLEGAKIKHEGGMSGLALRVLGKENVESMASLSDKELLSAAKKQTLEVLGVGHDGMSEKECLNVFVRSALKSTRWMIEGGLKGSAEIMARFRIINRVAPKFEKGHFAFGKYIDSVLMSRINALQGNTSDQSIRADNAHWGQTIADDETCQQYVLLAIQHYAETLQCDVKLHKYVYQALPRLLSLWFDFTAIKVDGGQFASTRTRSQDAAIQSLKKCQSKTNQLMAECYKLIPAHAFYTAMAQLVSRICHTDSDTASVTQAILRRILVKYPAQALWPLAWIRHSQDEERKRIGNEIFVEAERTLREKEKFRRLLSHSKILLDYLYNLAIKDVPKGMRSVKVHSISKEVDLCEFVPPIQAALSASLANGDSGRTRDAFPRFVPRMRCIDTRVTIFSSKAKPKKLTALVVPADPSLRPQKTSAEQAMFNKGEYDIGEITFLLKQEAKGDLRKDARVQDLNNVVNRLMAEYNESKGLGPQQRRLHLRTFTVTCLSEATGLLEWVPYTAPLRSLLDKTFNPQAAEQDEKRRGRRITNFLEPKLHQSYQEAQNKYFKEGDLSKAAAHFENEVLKSYPPLLYWWFVHQYPDPHRWYEARTRFTLSAAAWSAVGFVIGLGDRHTENILLDGGSGECVHVDFDCIFDKGLTLPKPEVVPFRLTQNIVDAFGPTGTDGMYSSNLKTAMTTLRKNRDTLLSVLEPFVKDPVISWKRSSSSQKSTRKDPITEAKREIRVIDERLRGIYNLRNPNHRKVPRSDATNDEFSHHPLPLSVEGQVQKMIAEATSSENLVQLYYGWMPWA